MFHWKVYFNDGTVYWVGHTTSILEAINVATLNCDKTHFEIVSAVREETNG